MRALSQQPAAASGDGSALISSVNQGQTPPVRLSKWLVLALAPEIF